MLLNKLTVNQFFCLNAIKSFSKLDLSEKLPLMTNNLPESNGLVSLFNPKHISALLCHYSKLKEDTWGNFRK